MKEIIHYFRGKAKRIFGVCENDLSRLLNAENKKECTQAKADRHTLTASPIMKKTCYLYRGISLYLGRYSCSGKANGNHAPIDVLPNIPSPPNDDIP